MNRFDVTVTGANYRNTFVSAKYPTKLQAMKAVLDLVRNVEGVTEELTATARVRRAPIEVYTPAIGV
jgi:hypothetical protein